jgi:hypothetical protein
MMEEDALRALMDDRLSKIKEFIAKYDLTEKDFDEDYTIKVDVLANGDERITILKLEAIAAEVLSYRIEVGKPLFAVASEKIN